MGPVEPAAEVESPVEDAARDQPSNISFLPLTPITVNDAVEEFNPGIPDLEKNWAGSPSVREYIRQNILQLLDDTRNNRMQLQEEWQEIRNMRMLKHDANQSYIGRSKAYIPSYNRGAKSLVSQLTRGLFPSEDYLAAMALDSQNDEEALQASAYVKWELEQNAKIRIRIKPMLREYVDYGTGVGKVGFHVNPKRGGSRTIRRGMMDKVLSALGKSGGSPEYAADSCFDGVRFSARSIYHWYVFPWTASNLDEAQFVFEDIEVTKDFIMNQAALGRYDEADAKAVALGGNEPANWRNAEANKLSAVQENPTSPVDTTGSERGRQVVLTEIWCSIPMPKEGQEGDRGAYVEGEDPNDYLPVVAIVAGSYILSVRRNPLWHQRFPYVVAQSDVDPGVFYGRGTGHNGRGLQYLANDFLNQMNDNGTYGLNPVGVYNPTLINGEMPARRPGVMIPSLDPANAIKWDRPPIDQVAVGERIAKLMLSLQQDFMGIPPIQQGASAGGNASTATGAQILQHNANTPLQDQVEELETQVMVPTAEMAWLLGQQYRSGQVLMQTSGGDIKLDASELAGRYLFQWLASSQATSAQQRTKQVLMLLQQLMPLLPVIMQGGYQVDVVPLLRKVYTEGFGYRGFDSFIKKAMAAMPGAAPGQPGMPMPGQPPTAGPIPAGAPGSQAPAPTDNIRSALAGKQGADGPMQPGEGGHFANVRDAADDISKGLGGH